MKTASERAPLVGRKRSAVCLARIPGPSGYIDLINNSGHVLNFKKYKNKKSCKTAWCQDQPIRGSFRTG
uniref:Uncharacterized protein n=1 Tax=Anguilla anguilla TaxID=7936 RepID=A0A0E9WX19_ANGAN